MAKRKGARLRTVDPKHTFEVLSANRDLTLANIRYITYQSGPGVSWVGGAGLDVRLPSRCIVDLDR